jgi:lipoprotein-anchoring transpeptidase ErfK/SrfK
VFATLVSSGKPGHDTPTGAFRVRHKHVSTTMRGEDPIDGPYEVEEVPWTMYYSGGYALHGAYWHDAFGRVRSHGCTNIAPADARWLLRWTDPPLPAGWHSIRRRPNTAGTLVYITE